MAGFRASSVVVSRKSEEKLILESRAAKLEVNTRPEPRCRGTVQSGTSNVPVFAWQTSFQAPGRQDQSLLPATAGPNTKQKLGL